MNRKEEEELIVIFGFIKSNYRDKYGKVIEIAIETEEFEKYLVDDNGCGRELLYHIQEKVQAQGIIIGEDIEGHKIFRISHYRLIEKRLPMDSK